MFCRITLVIARDLLYFESWCLLCNESGACYLPCYNFTLIGDRLYTRTIEHEYRFIVHNSCWYNYPNVNRFSRTLLKTTFFKCKLITTTLVNY